MDVGAQPPGGCPECQPIVDGAWVRKHDITVNLREQLSPCLEMAFGCEAFGLPRLRPCIEHKYAPGGRCAEGLGNLWDT